MYGLDKHENNLIDLQPTKFQTKYGRPQKTIVRYTPFTVKEHLERINRYKTKKPTTPKILKKVDDNKKNVASVF